MKRLAHNLVVEIVEHLTEYAHARFILKLHVMAVRAVSYLHVAVLITKVLHGRKHQDGLLVTVSHIVVRNDEAHGRCTSLTSMKDRRGKNTLKIPQLYNSFKKSPKNLAFFSRA